MTNHKARNQWQDAKKRVVATGLQMARDLTVAQNRARHAEALLALALRRIALHDKITLSEALTELMEEFDGADSEGVSGPRDNEVPAAD
jgi:hypothetical protein